MTKMKHGLALVTALLFTICAWSAEKPSTPAAPAKRIGLEEFDKLRAANTNIVILDVRSAAEFEKGRIAGATNIDFNSLRFEQKVGALDRNKIYIVNCAVGMRSARACKKLQGLGFKELYDLAPGFDGWKKSGRPFEK
jgi:rhodanese-related sulfurtransferase